MNKVELVRKWGNSNSDAVLDKECLEFSLPGIEGFIGYKLEAGTAIVFGDPVAAPDDQKALALAFSQAFANTIYIATSESFANWALLNVCKTAIAFGEELCFDPHKNPKEFTGTHASLVRRKVRHAEKENVTVQEYSTKDPLIEEKILQVGHNWLKSRTGPQMHISKVNIFENTLGKRWFYAQKDDAIVAIVTLNQLQNGYLLNHLMMTPDAPHGAPELLFVSVLEKLQKENCSYITIGAVPTQKLGKIEGLSPPFSWIVQFFFMLVKRYYRLEGRGKFWEKFHPQSKPSFVLFSNYSFSSILHAIKALHAKE